MPLNIQNIVLLVNIALKKDKLSAKIAIQVHFVQEEQIQKLAQKQHTRLSQGKVNAWITMLQQVTIKTYLMTQSNVHQVSSAKVAHICQKSAMTDSLLQVLKTQPAQNVPQAMNVLMLKHLIVALPENMVMKLDYKIAKHAPQVAIVQVETALKSVCQVMSVQTEVCSRNATQICTDKILMDKLRASHTMLIKGITLIEMTRHKKNAKQAMNAQVVMRCQQSAGKVSTQKQDTHCAKYVQKDMNVLIALNYLKYALLVHTVTNMHRLAAWTVLQVVFAQTEELQLLTALITHTSKSLDRESVSPTELHLEPTSTLMTT